VSHARQAASATRRIAKAERDGAPLASRCAQQAADVNRRETKTTFSNKMMGQISLTRHNT